MQRIKTVRYPVKNIGGDRAYCKLRYVVGQPFGIPQGSVSNSQNQVMNIGADNDVTLQPLTLNGIMGNTPNLSTMATLYMNYRIKGIKYKLTYWQTGGDPIILYTNAAPDTQPTNQSGRTGPVPAFITPTIATVSEQRWAKTRVCSQTQNGGKPTRLQAYYSVNRVQGPDVVVKNDSDYTGQMQLATPYWSNAAQTMAQPRMSPWAQFGITTLAGIPAATAVTGVLRVEQTVYVEFFGKRPATE